jgi:CBS domain-containing protein
VRLQDFLASERVIVPLEALTLQEASSALLERVACAHGVLDAARLRERVAEARGEDVVAMGDCAFLVHVRTEAVGQLLVAIGIASAPIRSADDGDVEHAARVVLFIATPPRHAVRYLQVVGAFARLLRKPELLAAMHAASSPSELLAMSAFAEYSLPEQLTVRDVMTERPRSITAETTLQHAARTLVRTGLGALPVVDDERRVIGMLSEREVIRQLLNIQAFTGPDARAAVPHSLRGRTVRDVMSRRVLCVAPEQPIAEVAALMSNKDVDRVPVVGDGQLVGFLTRGDIVRKLIGS